MAERAKPATGRKKAEKKGKTNGIPPEELRKSFGSIHSILDQMEEDNAAGRGEVGRIYEKMSDKWDVPKSALMLVFKRERREMKDNAKAAKMDRTEREGLQMVAEAIGGSIGDWAKDFASKIPDAPQGEGAEE